jgi:thioredoxin 1
MLVPVLEQFALELKDKVIVAKVDVFISPKTTTEFQITSVPTLILFHQGKPVQRLIGLQDLKTLKTLLATSLVP